MTFRMFSKSNIYNRVSIVLYIYNIYTVPVSYLVYFVRNQFYLCSAIKISVHRISKKSKRGLSVAQRISHNVIVSYIDIYIKNS